MRVALEHLASRLRYIFLFRGRHGQHMNSRVSPVMSFFVCIKRMLGLCLQKCAIPSSTLFFLL